MSLLIFAAILGSYLLAHAAAWALSLFFFAPSSAIARLVLAFSLIVLALSFVLALFLTHRHLNTFTHVFYYLSGTWVGMLLNFLLVGAAAFLAAKVWGIEGEGLRILGTAAVLGAAVWTSWGIYNAQNIKVKEYKVAIENLPDAWVGKSIVQLSDIHYGYVFGPDFLKKIVEKANSLEPSLVAITGDLFDGTSTDFSKLAPILKGLKAEYGAVAVFGNHETYLGTETAAKYLQGSEVRVLRDEVLPISGLSIAGLDYPPPGAKKDVAQTLRVMGFPKEEKNPAMLLWHVPTQIDAAKESGISLVLSGHTHKGQMFPFGLITRAIFGSYHYGIVTDGYFSAITTTGVGGWGPPLRTSGQSEIVRIVLERKP